MSSGFISETEIVEARRRRQEEWEKVRTEDQPKGTYYFVGIHSQSNKLLWRIFVLPVRDSFA